MAATASSPAAGYGSDGVYRSPRPAAPIASDPGLSLADLVLRRAAACPSALALVDAATGRALTFGALRPAVLVAAAGTDVRAAWAQRPGLGDPDRVEQATADGRGRFTDFAHGSVYWSPETGAHEVSGPILDAWRARGADRSELGLPTGEEYGTSAGRAQAFEHGVLRWDRTSGATGTTPA